jgi:hypothetical protein
MTMHTSAATGTLITLEDLRADTTERVVAVLNKLKFPFTATWRDKEDNLFHFNVHSIELDQAWCQADCVLIYCQVDGERGEAISFKEPRLRGEGGNADRFMSHGFRIIDSEPGGEFMFVPVSAFRR